MSSGFRTRILDALLTAAVALLAVATAYAFLVAIARTEEQREYGVSDWCRSHPAECGLPTPNRSTKE